MTDETIDLKIAEVIALHGGLAPDEHLYVLDGGIAITTGDQDAAWDWDRSRPLREQMIGANGNAASTGTTCVCGCSVEEHGNDPEFPGSTAWGECPEGDCIAYEPDGGP